jgi:major membrane immunogen (membrane-anchored lipoprotein)
MNKLLVATFIFVLSATAYSTSTITQSINNDSNIDWNYHSDKNNCYNYALGIQNDKFQQPGMASGNFYQTYSCDDENGKRGMVQAAISDGLKFVDAAEDCKDGERVIALVVAKGMTYHWFRREENGIWTHKSPSKSPTNLDFSGNIITDILTANRGAFDEFCGFFCVDYQTLKVK